MYEPRRKLAGEMQDPRLRRGFLVLCFSGGSPDAPAIALREIIVMIKLTRLDNEQFVLNAELIRYIEARPDTFVTLISGERLVVLETMDEVVERAVTYQQTKNLFPTPGPAARATA